MKKRFFAISVSLPLAASSFAQTGMSGLSDAADGVGSYLPYVQALCYAIAAVIAVVGAVGVYLSMQTVPQQTSKRIMMTVGSCLTFVFMAIDLPQFFGLDGSYTSGSDGNTGSNETAGTSDGFLASDEGGISQSGINTEIPAIQDKTGNWITFPEGTNMSIANGLMNIWDHMGSGVEGSYGRTLDYINREYHSGNMDHDTFEQMMRIAGNLPHN